MARFSRSQRSPAITKGGTLYYPIWLAYAAGYAEENGHEIKLIDCSVEKHGSLSLVQEIRNFNPQLAIIDTSTPSIYNDVAFCSKIKEIVPACTCALVGTHPSALPEETLSLSKDVDIVVRGEYDITISELANIIEE